MRDHCRNLELSSFGSCRKKRNFWATQETEFPYISWYSCLVSSGAFAIRTCFADSVDLCATVLRAALFCAQKSHFRIHPFLDVPHSDLQNQCRVLATHTDTLGPDDYAARNRLTGLNRAEHLGPVKVLDNKIAQANAHPEH
jgi:hypothetical protein